MSVDLCWEHNTFNMLVSCCFSKLGVAMAYNVLAKPGRGINTASRPTVWFEDLSLFKIFKFVRNEFSVPCSCGAVRNEISR